MSAAVRWRRMVARLAQHASWVVSGAKPRAEAMRHEHNYIKGDAAALRSAVGSVLTSYRARLARGRCFRVGSSFRFVGASGALTVMIGLALMGHASSRPLRPVFNETVCDLPGVSPKIGPRLRCGTVSVPRNYDNSEGGRFKLTVVIVRSAQQPALPDPVVYISGGPGSPLTDFAGQWARTLYAGSHDLILVDQRGTGRSEPKLCPELDRAFLDAAVAVATDPSGDVLAKRRTVYAACHAEALAHGIDLKDFGTRVTVSDFEWVRRALGIKRWNVYGESYGTTVAMTLLVLHADTVRSAVLDSVYPPDPRPLQSTNVADALDAFFRYCAADQTCATAYPDLAGTYRETLARLARAPLAVNVPPTMQVPDDRVNLTSTLFEALVSRLIYYSSAYPGMPRLIASVHDRDSQGLGHVLASARAALAAEVTYSTNLAVECRDRPHYRERLPADASVLDRLQPYGLCDDWSAIGPAPLVPTGTAVPTLVLAGEFDPVARPSESQHVAALMGPNARWIEFPLLGHDVSTPLASSGRAFSPCGAKIVAGFIDNPARSQDTSCVDPVAPIRFLPR